MSLQPPPSTRWTFTTDAGSGPQMSGRRFDTPMKAAEAASEWLRVCAENNFFPAVQLGTVCE